MLRRLYILFFHPAWSPDGKRLVVDVGDAEALNSLNTDGTGRRLLWLSGHVDGPAWSPNGRWIAFQYEQDDLVGSGEYDLYLMRATGSDPRRLTRTRTDEGRPSWSPDGTRLVFAGDTGIPSGIFVLTLRTGRQRLLAKGGLDPVWSPDGRRIAFKRPNSMSNGSFIYLARPNGRDLRRLTTVAGGAPPRDWQRLTR